MSSSFSVPCARPASIAALAASIDRPALVLAHAPREAMRTWPARPALVYLPGASSRGVELVHDGERLTVRIVALSSPADYDLAFRILEVLGGTSLVEPEEGEAAPADQVRARFGGDWMIRDRAVAVAALRASLATGNAVSIAGPVAALEIAPDTTADLADAWMILRDANAKVPDEPDAGLGLAVVIAGGRATAYLSDIGAGVLAFLAKGHSGAEAAARAAMPVAADVVYDTEAGWIADLQRKRLLVQRRPGAVLPALDRWTGFAITEHDDGHDLAAYLGEHGLGLPTFRVPDPDPAWDAVECEVSLGAAEHMAWLHAQERALPRRKNTSTWLLVLPLVLLLAGPALVVRLVTMPFRGVLRRRWMRETERSVSALRTRAIEQTRALAAANDVVIRHDRALALMSMAMFAAADRELLACVDGETLAPHNARRNLALVRHHARLYKLSARTMDEAVAAGYRRPSLVRRLAGPLLLVARKIANIYTP